MIVKVCGIKTMENIASIDESIDMIGLNFYRPSSRYVNEPSSTYAAIPASVKQVGVFVNATIAEIEQQVEKFDLDYVQLHGDESCAFAKDVAKIAVVIKVYRIQDAADIMSIEECPAASYNLLDYKTDSYGGSGKKFDWEILEKYPSQKSFLLSGGIGPEDAAAIQKINHPKFVGIDINSKFESKPAIKDMDQVKAFIKSVKKQKA